MYRSEMLRCAACPALMEVVPVTVPRAETVHADVCPACSLVFLEYFDGEPIGVAALLLKARPDLRTRPSLDGGSGQADHDAGVDEGEPAELPRAAHCPGCGSTEVEHLRYLDGPWVSRCHGCMGLMATQPELVALSQHRVAPEPTSPFALLLARVRRFLKRR